MDFFSSILYRIKKIKIIQLCNCFIQLIIFLILYIVSRKYFNHMYLFEWTVRHHYANIWILIIVLCLFNKSIISASITLGNVLGVFLGQYLGDYIKAINIKKVEWGTPSYKKYLLYKHPGFMIWVYTLCIFVVLGIICQYFFDKKRKFKKDK